MEFRVWGLGFGVWGLGFCLGVWGYGFEVLGFGSGVCFVSQGCRLFGSIGCARFGHVYPEP